MLLLPNRSAAFQFVDGIFARGKRSAAMRRGDCYRDRDVTHREIADAVHDRNRAGTETLASLGCDSFEFLGRHVFMRFVREAGYGTIVVGTFAHDAGKRNDGAARVGPDFTRDGSDVYWFAYDRKH
jgi:hypothetical protein